MLLLTLNPHLTNATHSRMLHCIVRPCDCRFGLLLFMQRLVCFIRCVYVLLTVTGIGRLFPSALRYVSVVFAKFAEFQTQVSNTTGFQYFSVESAEMGFGAKYFAFFATTYPSKSNNFSEFLVQSMKTTIAFEALRSALWSPCSGHGEARQTEKKPDSTKRKKTN